MKSFVRQVVQGAAGALAATLVLAAPAQAQQKIVPAQSEIVFTSKQMGVPVEGRFKKFDAQVAFDPKKPDASKIAFTIDLASASIGAPETEEELTKPGWFDSKAHPQGTFTSTSVRQTAPGRLEVVGRLAIKGNVQDVTVPVTLAQTGASTTANGSFAIKRLDFKIGQGEWSDTSIVANDVQVRFKLTLTGVAAM